MPFPLSILAAEQIAAILVRCQFRHEPTELVGNQPDRIKITKDVVVPSDKERRCKDRREPGQRDPVQVATPASHGDHE
jgi:hypothetical protein